ncbi:MAG: hypothetical protein ACFFD4_38215, partial [Candidatus Odinarchaeota archaeon]
GHLPGVECGLRGPSYIVPFHEKRSSGWLSFHAARRRLIDQRLNPVTRNLNFVAKVVFVK